MRCKHCDARLAAHDFWCANCGKQTPVVNKDLSSWASLKNTWKQLLPFKGLNIPAAAGAIIIGVIPIIVVLVVLNAFGHLNLSQDQATGSLLLNLFMIVVGVSIFFPMLLLPFKPVCAESSHSLKLKALLAALKHYPRYLLLTLIPALYFVVIYLICFGLPNFSSDPILRLVWIVLANYFLALFLPVPVLMDRLSLNPWKAFKLSYKNFHVVRWQLYLLALILLLINLLATGLALVLLIFTLPLTWFAVRDYTDRLLEYEIIRQYK
ncbi:MAG: hypothetical protein PHD87_03180 [Candidatus Cloacimonetes bacterium]|nr:hypothetical protein [Candidatus Cloacimonadota bacterium]